MVSSHGRTCLHDVAQMLWWAPSKPSDSTDEHNQLRHEQMQDLCLRLIQELPTQSLAQEDESKCTALTYCAGSSLEDACLRILDRLQGAKIKVKVQLENCEEHEVEHEMLERVTKLRSLDGRTALHWASAKGLLSVVQRLAAGCVLRIDHRGRSGACLVGVARWLECSFLGCCQRPRKGCWPND